MKTHEFTLILGGLTDVNEDVANVLVEAGCDDATFGTTGGVAYLDFAREAGSFRAAVMSAIADVQRANVGLRVLRVEPDELVTSAEIAKRLGRSRESIRLLVAGKRGPGDFPPPVARATARSPLYRWTEVACWADERKSQLADEPQFVMIADMPEVDPDAARTIGVVNAALEMNRYARAWDEVVRVMGAIGQEGAPPPAGKKAAARRKIGK